MDRFLKFGLPFLVIVVFAYSIYAQVRQDTRFNDQLKEIQNVRLAMEDSVRILKQRTAVRDQELRELIKRDLEILDTLNLTLAKLNRSSKAIESKIEENKKAVDRLWAAN